MLYKYNKDLVWSEKWHQQPLRYSKLAQLQRKY